MKIDSYVKPYRQHLKNLLENFDHDEAMSLLVGGQFKQIGQLEYSLLKYFGLKKDHDILDIGCGSGRLAYILKDYLTGKYIGFDILKEPLDYARRKCSRADWEFNLLDGRNLPYDSCFDFVTFFSVFTHILEEDIFFYLQETSRILKANGKIVFSFLDFECESHWTIFEESLKNRTKDEVMNKFLSKSTIEKWAQKLHLKIDGIFDGDTSFIPLEDSNTISSGLDKVVAKTAFGQSVAVLSVLQI